MKRLILACLLALVGAAASAQSIPFPGPGMPAAAGGGGFSFTFGGSAFTSNTSAATVDFLTINFGGSSCTRIVVGVQWYLGSATISSVTVAGNSLTQVPGARAAASNVLSDVYVSSSSIAGSSGDVQVTWAAAQGFTASVGVYCLVTTTPGTAFASNGTANPGTAVSATVNIPSGGRGIVVSNATNGHTATFTNAAVDADITAGGTNQYFAHTTATGASTTITATYSASDSEVFSVAAWGP